MSATVTVGMALSPLRARFPASTHGVRRTKTDELCRHHSRWRAGCADVQERLTVDEMTGRPDALLDRGPQFRTLCRTASPLETLSRPRSSPCNYGAGYTRYGLPSPGHASRTVHTA